MFSLSNNQSEVLVKLRWNDIKILQSSTLETCNFAIQS